MAERFSFSPLDRGPTTTTCVCDTRVNACMPLQPRSSARDIPIYIHIYIHIHIHTYRRTDGREPIDAGKGTHPQKHRYTFACVGIPSADAPEMTVSSATDPPTYSATRR
eukprot:GHVU01102715.1.p4 GENE.GHVU01102715.1~~GHVU01102715.1.p4  ORF type:complete len:109 (+),score=2.14 GHVU01102715.1:307-633(+)